MESANPTSFVEPSGICWHEPAEVFPKPALDFCQETSLHGVKYICQPKRHLSERIFWLLTLIAGGITAGILITKLWEEYLYQPIITFSSFETTIGQIPFPAVSVCNSNLIRRSQVTTVQDRIDSLLTTESNEVVDWFLKYSARDVRLAHYICNNQTTFGQRFASTRNKKIVQDVLDRLKHLATRLYEHNVTANLYYFSNDISHTCLDMFKKCQLNGLVVDCGVLFTEQFHKIPGFCLFNGIKPKIYDIETQRLIQLWKTGYETEALYNSLEYWEKEYLSWFSDLEKRDALLLSTRLEESTVVPPGNFAERHNWYTPRRQRNSGKSTGLSIILDPELDEYTCGITDSEGFLIQVHPVLNPPNLKETGMLIKPNTEVFIEVTPIVTLANENLKQIPIDYRNCYFQNEKYLAITWYYTLDMCIDECIYNVTNLECKCDSSNSMAEYYGFQSCLLEEFICSQERIKNWTRNEFAKHCNCLPLCTTVEYTTRVTTAVIDSGKQFQGLNSVAANENETVVSMNQLSIVHIYFVDNFVLGKERKKMFGLVEFIASAGGVLGLCLGFSALSLLECVYFLTFRLWCQNRRTNTISKVITRNLARLVKRQQETDDVPENRRIQLAIHQLQEEVRQEMLAINELAFDDTSPV